MYGVMNKTYLIAGGVVAVIIVAAVGAYFMMNKGAASGGAATSTAAVAGDNSEASAAGAANTDPAAFKTNYRDSFVQSCEKSAGGAAAATSICTCVADYLVTKYDVASLTDLSQQMIKDKITGTLPQEITDAVKACRPSAGK